MKFYNREEELSELENLNRKKPVMVVITGRRRVGKTELILKFLERYNGIYLYVDPEKSEKSLLEEFKGYLTEKISLPAYISIDSWEKFLELIFTQKVQLIISIDEFQRFSKLNPSFITQLQKYWDIYKKGSNICLILSGSSVGMIKKIFIKKGAPLFKRASNIIFLQPFKFKQIREILADFGILDFEEQIRIYSLFGGVIYYYALMDQYGAEGLQGVFDKLIFRKFAPLRNEISDIMIEEFGKEHRTYYSIINGVALGKTTKKELKDVSDIKDTSLSPYLYDLIDLLGIMDYSIPITETKPWRSKKGRYFLKDNFFRFWFRFIYKNMSYYEANNYSYIFKKLKQDFNSFVGRAFESICKEVIERVNERNQLPFNFEKVGKWWGHYREKGERKSVEIDIVALNEQSKDVMFCECKWQNNVNIEKVLNELKEKAKCVQWNNEKRKEHYAIFAKSFKDKEKIEKKIEGKNILFFDLKAIERALKK